MKRPNEWSVVAAESTNGWFQVTRLASLGPLEACGRSTTVWIGLMWWGILGVVLLCLVDSAIGGTAAGEDEEAPKPSPPWRVSATAFYSSGTYGGDSRTNILYAPLTLRRVFQDGDLSLTIPFVSISGTGSVRLVGGVPTRTDTVGGGSSGTGGGGAGRGKSPGALPLGASSTDGGVGDLILRGRYYVAEEGGILPLVAVTGRLKLPTADADRGLGTGEFDEGAGLELTKTIADRWVAYLDGGYNIIGDAPGTNFNNQWWYDVGIGHDVTNDLHLSVFYEEYRALVNSVNNARDLLVIGNYILDERLHVNTSLLVGLSNGAPQYGVSAGVRVRF